MSFLLYDIAIAAILIFFFFHGRKKGLILTLCGLAAFFVAVFGASFVSDAAAPQVAGWLEPHISTAIEDQLGDNVQKSLDELLAAGETGDNTIVSVLTALGFYDEVADAIRSAAAKEGAQAAADSAAALACAAAEVVAKVLVFIVAFILISIAWFFLSRVLNLAAKLPVIKGLNRLLGGLFGLLQGMLLLFLVGWVLRLMGDVIPQETVEQTVLLKFFCSANPLSLITGI